jgi:orotidine-5'-phosphate decarboxylase
MIKDRGHNMDVISKGRDLFADRLMEKIANKGNPSVLGLDPRIELIPECFKEDADGRTRTAAEAVLEFNKALIDAVWDLVPAVKLQIAFYEALGLDGMLAYRQTVQYAAGKGLITIGDVKRGDISSTADAYKAAHLDGYFACDAITLNPYLGFDSVEPFIAACKDNGKGIFILVKTSNRSSGDFQNLMADGEYLYVHVARKVSEWGLGIKGGCGYSSVGAVVGATYPEELRLLRSIMPNVPFLVPGYGAQGASGDDVANAFDKNGLGAIVNSSRKVMTSYLSAGKGTDVTRQEFVRYARQEAINMKEDIKKGIEKRLVSKEGW